MAEPRDRDADLEADFRWAVRAMPPAQIEGRIAVDDLRRWAKQARDGWDAAETANHELSARVAQLTRLQRAVVEAQAVGETIPQHVVMLARGEGGPEEQQWLLLVLAEQEAIVLRNLAEQWDAEHISELRSDLGIISGVRAKLNAIYERIGVK